jgi:hypothetical protein
VWQVNQTKKQVKVAFGEFPREAKVMSQFRVIGALVSAGLFFPAIVCGEGFYAGGSLGFAKAEFSGSIFNNRTFDGDETLGLIKGFGGYRVNRGLAIEGSLVGAANDDYDDDYYCDDGNCYYYNNSGEVTFGAIGAAVLGIIPATDAFELFGKAGYYFGESEIGNWNSEDESGLLLGAGTFINIGSRRQFTIRVEYEYYDVDELDDFWSLTGGFQYNFK